MERGRAGWVRLALGALVLVMGSGHAAERALYYVRHATEEGSATQGSTEYAGFHGVELQQAANGRRRVQVQPLWWREANGPQGDVDAASLDPDNADDARVLALVRGGFASSISGSGSIGALEAQDAEAARALRAHDRDQLTHQLLRGQAPGIRPFVLPRRLAVGERAKTPMRLDPFGALTAEVEVLEVTPAEVVLALQVRGRGIEGAGRVAVDLADGMPIELRMELTQRASRSVPARVHRIHVADMAFEPRLEMAEDLAMYQDYVGQIEETLSRPPFDGTVDEVGLYRLDPVPAGELQPHMVAADALPALERNMGFGWLPDAAGGRARLALGARSRLSTAPGDEALLVARLNAVVPLDASGEPITGLQPQAVMRTLFLPSHYTADEQAVDFPFRLPLGSSQALRDALATLRLMVGAEVYSVHSVETVPVGQPSAVNASVEIDHTSPLRVTVRHARQAQRGPKGLWTVVVPLDAAGEPIPFTELSVLPIRLGQVNALAELPLAWESRNEPFRLEIAAQRPISQLQLRHYQWVLEPRTWDFRLLP